MSRWDDDGGTPGFPAKREPGRTWGPQARDSFFEPVRPRKAPGRIEWIALLAPPVPRAEAANRRVAVRVGIPETVGNPGFLQIVRAHHHLHGVPGGYFDKVLAKFSRNVREHAVSIREFDPEHGSGQNGNNLSFDFYFIFWHGVLKEKGMWKKNERVKP